MDAERSAAAARLLHEMARSERLTQEIGKLFREQFTLLGEGRTLSDAFVAWMFNASTLLPDSGKARDFARRLTVEAERRAQSGEVPPDGLSAYDVLRDLQTLGLRLMENADFLIEVLVGQSVIGIASNDGADILDAAGRPEEAEALLTHGRRLLEPQLVWNLSGRGPNLLGGSTVRLYDDPELRARAEALPPSTGNTMCDAFCRCGVDLFRIESIMRSLESHDPFGAATLGHDDLVAWRHWKVYGFAVRWLTLPWLSAAYLAVFAFLCALSGWHWLKTRKPPSPAAFPSVGRMLLTGVTVFLIAWALPAALTAFVFLAPGFADDLPGRADSAPLVARLAETLYQPPLYFRSSLL
jgi:hypothetical protein